MGRRRYSREKIKRWWRRMEIQDRAEIWFRKDIDQNSGEK